MSDFIVKTTDGDLDPALFLEDVSDGVWPKDADSVEFSLTGDCEGVLLVTYVLEPFGIVHTVEYPLEARPEALYIRPFSAVPLRGTVGIKDVARAVSKIVYEDFKLEVTP